MWKMGLLGTSAGFSAQWWMGLDACMVHDFDRGMEAMGGIITCVKGHGMKLKSPAW